MSRRRSARREIDTPRSDFSGRIYLNGLSV
jgi:hypothetical protein